jgi:hypothetical protein
MDNNYFGIVTHPEFPEWDEDTQNQYLLEIGYFTFKLSSVAMPVKNLKVPGEFNCSFQFNPNNKIYICNTELQKNIYNYILERYISYLKVFPLKFFIAFKDSTFGLDTEEARKIALDEFNIIYNNLDIEPISLKDRFELLHLERKYYISEISEEREIALAYLTGDEDFFNVALYESNQSLQGILSFEGSLEILLELNKKYNFETDIYFDENAVLFEKFKNIKCSSITFEVFKFINYQIKTLKKSKRSELVSLYFFLKKIELFSETEKKFREMINDHFLPISAELKLADSTNKNHIKRMGLLKIEWDNFKN